MVLILFSGAFCPALAATTHYPGQDALPRPEVRFDRPSGFCSSGFDLALSTPLANATIYYTTNGVTPSPATGIRYQRPIPVATTTIVRAAAFDRETALTGPAAGTWLFLPHVLRQTGAGFPRTWGVNAGQPVPPHYGLSPDLTEDPAGRRALLEGLASLPSLSIITDPENLFGPETGIYTHPAERGSAWERPAAVELISPEGRPLFQINCGLRIHGGSSRRPEESPKHSFRLVFRQLYGAAKLRFPLFGAGAGAEFDTLILRAGNNDSWLHTAGEPRRRAAYIRDEWMRQSLVAMGYPSARGGFAHLYLNGLYWGLYNLCERPGAALPAPVQGGPPLEYDARKADRIESGDRIAWDRMMALADAGLAEPGPYQAICQCLDVAELADFLILNFYAANSDWDRSANWFAARPRTPEGKFRFFLWDAESTLGDLEANTLAFDDDESPPRLFHKLSENAEFRRLFAARARRLLLDNGPLAPGPAAQRFQALANSVGKPIVAEAARWGDYRRNVHSYKTGPFERYTPATHWQPEIQRLLAEYFPRRPALLLQQFRERGLFPPAPPTGQAGGKAGNGGNLR